jgi:hypothetical protein
MYHETLANAVLAGLATKLPKNVKLVAPDDISWEPMSYETSQSKFYPLEKMELGGEMGRKPMNRGLFISVYRMPSGRYETTAYLT